MTPSSHGKYGPVFHSSWIVETWGSSDDGGKKRNQNFLCWVFFSYQSDSQLRLRHSPCIASVTQLQLSHTASAHVFAGCFTYGPRLWTHGCCSRQLMAQVMYCLRWHRHRNRNPLSNRGINERLCFESSKFNFENLTNKKHLAFILRERQSLKSRLLIKNPSVVTAGTASSTINKSGK